MKKIVIGHYVDGMLKGEGSLFDTDIKENIFEQTKKYKTRLINHNAFDFDSITSFDITTKDIVNSILQNINGDITATKVWDYLRTDSHNQLKKLKRSIDPKIHYSARSHTLDRLYHVEDISAYEHLIEHDERIIKLKQANKKAKASKHAAELEKTKDMYELKRLCDLKLKACTKSLRKNSAKFCSTDYEESRKPIIDPFSQHNVIPYEKKNFQDVVNEGKVRIQYVKPLKSFNFKSSKENKELISYSGKTTNSTEESVGSESESIDNYIFNENNNEERKMPLIMNDLEVKCKMLKVHNNNWTNFT